MKAKLHAWGFSTPRLRRILGSPVLEFLLLPLIGLSAAVMLYLRLVGLQQLKLSRRLMLKIGVLPVRNHYYEPLLDAGGLSESFPPRNLPGIDWNIAAQLQRLSAFHYADELRAIPRGGGGSDATFYFGNQAFDAGDAEYWYSLIRQLKPRRIVEVGSGHSTKMARLALAANKREDPAYHCRHCCIEPYEMPWLEELEIELIRERVEVLDPTFFEQLQANDILFIDSSHIIRPQGDVLYLFTELLPRLAPGVIVHIHDIFSPYDYPRWMTEQLLLWNEQYLLEAFLTENPQWEILGSLYYLQRHYSQALAAPFPHLGPEDAPGSFYLRRR